MKTPMALLFLLGLSGAVLAQQAPVQATSSAQTETAATEPAVATGHVVARDTAGRPVSVTSHQPAPAPHDYRAEFDAIDRNGDGSLNSSEASADKYLAKTFASYDSDGDERLSFEEARLWLED